MKLIQNIGTYTFFNILSKATPFLLVPVLTNYLKPEEYALIDIFQIFFIVLLPLIGLSINSSISVFYFKYNEIQRKSLFSNAVAVNLLLGLILFLIVLPFDKILIRNFTGYKINYFITLAIAYTTFHQVIEVFLINRRLEFKALQYGLFNLIRSILELGLSLLLVALLLYGWEGRVLSQLGVNILGASISIFLLFKSNMLQIKAIDFKMIKASLEYSYPMIGHLLAAAVIGYSDRFFIIKYLGLEAAGNYAIAYQFGIILSLFSNSINQAWSPYVFKTLSNKPVNQMLKKSLNVTFFILVVGLCVIFLSPWIYHFLIDQKYIFNFTLVTTLILSYTINGMYRVYVNFLMYYKKSKLIALSTILVALINLLLNYLLIPVYGIVGAGFATLIAFLLHAYIIISSAYRITKKQGNSQ